MFNRRINIKTKIVAGFLFLIIFFAGNAIVSFLYLNNSETITTRISEVNRPSIIALNELKLLVHDSKSYINTWTKVDLDDHPDKRALVKIHKEDYQGKKSELLALSKKWTKVDDRETLEHAFAKLDTVIMLQSSVMNEQLTNFDAYQDMMVLMEVDGFMTIINPVSDQVSVMISKVIESQKNISNKEEAKMVNSFSSLRFSSTFLAAVVVILGLIVAFILSRMIVTPVNQLKAIIDKLSKGHLPKVKIKKTHDEIGDMVTAVSRLTQGLVRLSKFADKIGQGELDAKFKSLSKKDVLGNALLSMRDNLQHADDEKTKHSKEEEKRTWATIGLAEFANILRNESDIEKLSNEVVSRLIGHLNANQGGVYLVTDGENGEEDALVLTGCYAYDRQKFVDKRVKQGEGLLGQCWVEKEKIYMTEIPDGYITITSGLGEATASTLLIVPLIVNDEVFGMLEIASFNEFEEYEIAFVERLGEAVAATLSSVKINERTTKLLRESQYMEEQLRAQEEEMRQNMEELQATQEEMKRNERVQLDRIKS